jgi:predicted GNAT family acetyltransferase
MAALLTLDAAEFRSTVLPDLQADPVRHAVLLEDFATQWAIAVGKESVQVDGARLYRLKNLRPQTVEGLPRLARGNDHGLVAQWIEQMILEAADPPIEAGAWSRALIQEERLWLWEANGKPASLVARRPTVEGVTRLGPIYTPPESRRHGYGSALTSHVSAVLRAAGSEVCLRTNLANPNSHTIYQALGFEPVADYHRYEFRA